MFLRPWAVNWLMSKSCPQGVPWEMKSLGSFYHLWDGVKTWQSRATRTGKLIWGRAMAPGQHAVKTRMLFKKNAKGPFTPKREIKSRTTVKWTAWSENTHLMPRPDQAIDALWGVLQFWHPFKLRLHIFVQNLLNEESGGRGLLFEREVNFLET